MSAELIVLWWRDIPVQVIVRAGRRSHKIQLPPRFQEAVDRAAMRGGLVGQDEYLGAWRRESRPCRGELEAEAVAEARSLEDAYPPSRLEALVGQAGVAAPASGDGA